MAATLRAGLTCTDDNAVQKGNAFKACAENGVMMVFPDTSPRGAGIAGEVGRAVQARPRS